MTKPEWPVLLPPNTLHLRAFDDKDSKVTRCGLKTEGVGDGFPDMEHPIERLCKRCFS